MNENRYFDTPTQVCFWDYDGNHWLAGIAWNQNIICSCCGGVFEIDEIYEYAPAGLVHPIIPFDTWIDLTNEIVGDTWPVTPFEDENGSIEDEENAEYEAYFFENLQDKPL